MVGVEPEVNAIPALNQGQPRIGVDAGGYFVIAWNGRGQEGDAGSDSNVYAQRYDAAGNKLGGEYRANTFTDRDQTDASSR